MDDSVHHLLEAAGPNSLLHQRIHTLCVAAAHCAESGAALLLLCQRSQTAIAVQHGESANLFPQHHDLLQTLLGSDLYVSREEGAQFTRELRQAAPDLRFVATVPVAYCGERVGLLVVCDPQAKTFSAAQEYLLHALATQIGDQFELEHLRKRQKTLPTASGSANERLRLLESVVVNANDAVLITEAEPIDLPGPRILYANAAFTRTTGYTVEEILGKTPRLLQGPATDREPLDRLKAALKAWKPVEVELQNYRKDGSTFWVELSIVPVADENGWYTHWVSVQRDISERRLHEQNTLRVQLAEARSEALAEEVKQRMRSEAELAHTAFHDHLTGLRNRAYLLDRLRISVEQSKTRSQYRCAVIFLDLDGFKEINDTLGHSVGDLTLIEVAQRLMLCSRSQDTVARMGGDEFTILVDDISDIRDVVAIAERCIRELTVPIRIGDHVFSIGASVGLSLGSYADPEHLLRAADEAMYRAKEDGGNRYAIFNEEMHTNVMSALRLRVELREAFEQSQFELFYQPLVNTDTDRICGVEALIRWRHPERGIVPPHEFISTAEETGLIIPLGLWILREACLHLKAWKSAQLLDRNFKVSVNVSTRQLEDPTFFANLERILEEVGIGPEDLQLEITESVFLKNPDRIGRLFRRIRSRGVQIACDDFGTGYSSLSYLQLYPIDTIKIDQSFVKRLRAVQTDADIVKMIVSLARVLRMQVSAEGVEDVRQRDMLKEYGCAVVQGYLYSRPLPLEDITRMLEQGLPSGIEDSMPMHRGQQSTE